MVSKSTSHVKGHLGQSPKIFRVGTESFVTIGCLLHELFAKNLSGVASTKPARVNVNRNIYEFYEAGNSVLAKTRSSVILYRVIYLSQL